MTQQVNLRTKVQADQRGTVAIIFAASIFVLGLASGMAIDFGRAYSVRHNIQAALDSAVMLAAQAMARGTTDLKPIATTAINADWHARHGATIATFDVAKIAANRVKGTISVNMPTTFMALAGHKSMSIDVSSTVKVGVPGADIVFVLDNTGSMSGAKLQSLKDAATQLVNTIYDNAIDANDVNIALVPFSTYVNVGLDKRNASWITVPDDYASTSTSCSDVSPILTTSNCRTLTGTGYNDGVAYSYQYQQCDHTYGTPVQQCSTTTTDYKWYGCVGSRDYPLNISDDSYGTQVPGLLNVGCSNKLMPLNHDRDLILQQINAMSASGETYIPSGLAWGWRLLSNVEPFAEAANSKAGARKIMILMTDGANTRSPNYPDHNGSDVSAANRLTSEVCSKIHAANIDVFTVTFDVTDSTIKTILNSCVSARGSSYDAANAQELQNAFANIAQELVTISLTF